VTDSTDIELPDDPWMSHAFISKLMTQVSLPYRKPKNGVKEVVRRNGNLTVKFTATGDCLPYGKYPRLFEMYACTMVKAGDPSFDPETRTLNLGTTFREFLQLIKVPVGGRQMQSIKKQLENLFSCVYTLDNGTSTTTDRHGFVVANDAHIDWLRNEPQEHGLFENTVRFSQEYIDYLRDSPVPVDLSIVAQLNSPMSLDVYWWLTRRYSYLHERQSITWQQLYNQFGSSDAMKSFKQSFQRAVDEVSYVYPQANITCGRNYVTIYPSETSVATTAQTRAAELLSKQSHERADRISERQNKHEINESDISTVMERLDYGDNYVMARRHVVHGLAAGVKSIDLITQWSEGKRL
jgi:NACalpha-BTF3-like transcription factor